MDFTNTALTQIPFRKRSLQNVLESHNCSLDILLPKGKTINSLRMYLWDLKSLWGAPENQWAPTTAATQIPFNIYLHAAHCKIV